jgi:CRISPR/Cas system-associated protein endoribonuclease Cas2
MKHLKKIIIGYENIKLLYNDSVKIIEYEYISSSLKKNEEFKALKEFYEKDFFIENNLSFNKMYVKIIKVLWSYEYDCITPQEALDFLSKNYDRVFNDHKKYIKYFIILCYNDDSYLKKFISENKDKILKNEDIIFKYFDIQNLSLYIKIINDKSNLEKYKKIILNHLKKNIKIYLLNLSNDDYALIKGLKDFIAFLKESGEKDWQELEDYLLFLINNHHVSHFLNILINYLVKFEKESKEVNAIILNSAVDHLIIDYVMKLTNEEFKNYYLKNKIKSTWDAYIFYEASNIKKLSEFPSFILDLIALDYNICFSYFLSNVNITGRFTQLENRMLKEKNYSAICKYVITFLKDRWKEAEPILKENDEYWKIYNDFIDSDDKEYYDDPLEDLYQD